MQYRERSNIITPPHIKVHNFGGRQGHTLNCYEQRRGSGGGPCCGSGGSWTRGACSQQDCTDPKPCGELGSCKAKHTCYRTDNTTEKSCDDSCKKTKYTCSADGEGGKTAGTWPDCSCPSNKPKWDGSQCIACPSGRVWRDVLTCNPNYPRGKACRCPSGTIPNSSGQCENRCVVQGETVKTFLNTSKSGCPCECPAKHCAYGQNSTTCKCNSPPPPPPPPPPPTPQACTSPRSCGNPPHCTRPAYSCWNGSRYCSSSECPRRPSPSPQTPSPTPQPTQQLATPAECLPG